tara:strand:+ start:28548 stop:29486 length:939 start_codon:yes stop_codon:yes gene_type:complete
MKFIPALYGSLMSSSIQEEAPKTFSEVTSSLWSTVLRVWSDFVAHFPYLVAGLVALISTILLAKLVRKIIMVSTSRSGMRESLRDVIARLAVIAVWVTGILIVAVIVFPGLSPAKAIGGLGLLSLAVGFAFKDIFENFFAGILLLWRFPFENGDFIECEGIEGKVERINLRMSEIRKTTGELVIVPNAFLFTNPVDVLTDKPIRRVTVMAGVSYDTDVSRAVDVLNKAVHECESVEKGSPIQIFPQGFGSSSIDIEVTWWTHSKPLDIRRSRAEVVVKIKEALDEAGIEIPFPYRTLTFKEPLPVTKESGDS